MMNEVLISIGQRPSSVARPALLLFALLNCAVLAQNAPLTVPDAGRALQQLPPPSVFASRPKLRIEQVGAGAIDAEATTPIAVRRIELSGYTVFDAATLQALVVSAEGTVQTLAQLELLARRITEYYRTHGQPLARAYLPAQSMKDGVLRIVVVEAVYGQVVVRNQSGIGTPQLQAIAAPLQGGDHVAQAPLERSLLLLQELAGVEVSAEASPGFVPGQTDLTITVIDAEHTARGSFGLDNMGSKSTGRLRVNTDVNLNNPIGHGESFSVVAVTSGGGLSYGRFGLQMPVNAIGTRMNVGYAVLHYELGDAFRALQANGRAYVLDGTVQHALVRSTRAHLNAELRLEQKIVEDRVDSIGFRNDRSISSTTLGLSGERYDEFLGGGANSLSLSYSLGQVSFDSSVALSQDQSTAGANTQGIFRRWNLALARTQSLGEEKTGMSFFGSLRLQGASRNLDSVEQIGISGPFGVRGYDNNALSGAQGYVATLELRRKLASNTSGVWLGKVFWDTGYAMVYKTPFTTAPNAASLHSVGLGLNWTGPTGWNAQLTLAQPVGTAPAIAAERAARLWLQIGGKL